MNSCIFHEHDNYKENEIFISVGSKSESKWIKTSFIDKPVFMDIIFTQIHAWKPVLQNCTTKLYCEESTQYKPDCSLQTSAWSNYNTQASQTDNSSSNLTVILKQCHL